jgi:hypothetical protein
MLIMFAFAAIRHEMYAIEHDALGYDEVAKELRSWAQYYRDIATCAVWN